MESQTGLDVLCKKTRIHLFWFSFQRAHLHVALCGRPLDLRATRGKKNKLGRAKSVFLQSYFHFLSIPCCFWRSHSSCWAQKWPPWRRRTERHFSRSAAAWSSWRCPAPKTPSDPSLGANVWNFSLHLIIFNLADVKILNDCEKKGCSWKPQITVNFPLHFSSVVFYSICLYCSLNCSV